MARAGPVLGVLGALLGSISESQAFDPCDPSGTAQSIGVFATGLLGLLTPFAVAQAGSEELDTRLQMFGLEPWKCYDVIHNIGRTIGLALFGNQRSFDAHNKRVRSGDLGNASKWLTKLGDYGDHEIPLPSLLPGMPMGSFVSIDDAMYIWFRGKDMITGWF